MEVIVHITTLSQSSGRKFVTQGIELLNNTTENVTKCFGKITSLPKSSDSLFCFNRLILNHYNDVLFFLIVEKIQF